ncbi:MAG: hypothetical protein KDD98_01920 [Sphingomonadaceae bacterium]|nr:hypothetical protein [Sphingomonadaceae bacterium]
MGSADESRAIVEIGAAKLGLRALACEYQILRQLYEHGPQSPKSLAGNNGSSPATFQKYLRNLCERQMIAWTSDPADQRRRLYSLSPGARQVFDEQLREAYDPKNYEDESEPQTSGSHLMVRRLEGRLKTRIFTTEFQIVMWLYDESPRTTGQLLEMSDVSPGAFYKCLGRLHDLGLIHVTADNGDRRRKCYCLSEKAHKVLVKTIAQWGDWTRRHTQGS